MTEMASDCHRRSSKRVPVDDGAGSIKIKVKIKIK